MAEVHFRRLERLFAGDRPKAEGCPELLFFELSQQATWGASRSVWKGSRRQSGMNIFSGYISEGWRGFSWGINQKPKAVRNHTFSGHRSRPLEEPRGRCGKAAEGYLELYFFGSSQRVAWGASRSVERSSRRLSGRNVFSGYISKGWSGFLRGIDPKPEAVWSYSFSGHRSRSLREPRGRWEKAAGGCLAGTSFRGTFPDAGETFCRELTKSRRLSEAALFRAIAAGRWRDFSKRIDQKPKAVWSCTFSGYRSGSLGEPRDRCGKAAGSGQALKLF